MSRPTSAFFQQQTTLVAQQLLGARIVRKWNGHRLEGYIVETEAYLPFDDPACHAAKGRTKRNSVMFGEGGLLYVYAIHSRYCMNVVTEGEGVGAAVLVRAVEPSVGWEQLRENRMLRREGQELPDIELTNGPGKLCDAFGVGIQENGIRLWEDETIWLEEGIPLQRTDLGVSGRIGIREGADLPLRFFVDGNKYVSGKASLHRQKRNRTLH